MTTLHMSETLCTTNIIYFYLQNGEIKIFEYRVTSLEDLSTLISNITDSLILVSLPRDGLWVRVKEEVGERPGHSGSTRDTPSLSQDLNVVHITTLLCRE